MLVEDVRHITQKLLHRVKLPELTLVEIIDYEVCKEKAGLF